MLCLTTRRQGNRAARALARAGSSSNINALSEISFIMTITESINNINGVISCANGRAGAGVPPQPPRWVIVHTPSLVAADFSWVNYEHG